MDPLKLIGSWSKEQTLMFLQELQKYPVLYDKTHPHYQFRVHRLTALRQLTNKFKPIKPYITPKLIKNKLRTIKSQYNCETKFMKRAVANAKPGAKPYKSKLWCFEILKSLYEKEESHLPLPEEENMIEDVSENSVEILSDDSNDPKKLCDESEIDWDEADTEPVQARSELQTRCLKLLNCLTSEIQDLKHHKANTTEVNTQESPNTFLGLMVESELGKVPEEIFEDAKWKIIRILEEAAKKSRELKTRPTLIGLPSTSTSTSPSISAYNVGSDTRVTVLGNNVFKVPLLKPNDSTK